MLSTLTDDEIRELWDRYQAGETTAGQATDVDGMDGLFIMKGMEAHPRSTPATRRVEVRPVHRPTSQHGCLLGHGCDLGGLPMGPPTFA